MIGGTHVLARGGDFALFRTPFGHLAVVGQMRDGLNIALAMANVDLVPTKSPCLVVDCAGSDYEARTVALTIIDWVLARASLEVASEVWLLPEPDGERNGFGKLAERVARRGIVVTYSEASALEAMTRILGKEVVDDTFGSRLAATLHHTRLIASRSSSLGSYASPMQRPDELLLRSAVGEISESIMVTDTELDEQGVRGADRVFVRGGARRESALSPGAPIGSHRAPAAAQEPGARRDVRG